MEWMLLIVSLVSSPSGAIESRVESVTVSSEQSCRAAKTAIDEISVSQTNGIAQAARQYQTPAPYFSRMTRCIAR